MNAKHIFKITFIDIDNYPMINFSYGNNGDYDWVLIAEMLDGEKKVNRGFLENIKLKIQRKIKKYDIISLTGNIIISEKAKDIFNTLHVPNLEFFKIKINDLPFFLFQVGNVVDCLNREKSIYQTFSHRPDEIMRIEKYVFHKNKVNDPLIFKIPEEVFLLATDKVKEKIENSDLYGFRFIDCENPPEGVLVS